MPNTHTVITIGGVCVHTHDTSILEAIKRCFQVHAAHTQSKYTHFTCVYALTNRICCEHNFFGVLCAVYTDTLNDTMMLFITRKKHTTFCLILRVCVCVSARCFWQQQQQQQKYITMYTIYESFCTVDIFQMGTRRKPLQMSTSTD